MRITVRRVLKILASYADVVALFHDYPFLDEENLQQVLRYASFTVEDQLIDIN